MKNRNEKTQETSSTKESFYNKYNHYIFVGILALIIILLFSEFIFSNKMLVSSDQIESFSVREYFNTSVKKYFQYPWWASPTLGGMPTVDAVFGDYMYPPSLLISLIFPVHKAYAIKMILHIFLAGVFFYILLYRGFKTSQFISFIGAAFYMLNTEFFSYIYSGHDGKMYVIALLPFVVWRLKVLMENPNILNASFLSFGIGFSILTGHNQLSFFVLWGLFFYWIMSCFLKWRNTKTIKTIIPHIIYFWIATFVGIAMAAIQLLPAALYVRDEFSVRGVERGFDFAASWSLHWPEIISLWVPEFCNTLGNYWGDNYFKLNSEYTGAITLLFAVISIVFKPKPWRLFWGGIAVFSILFSLGANTPVFHIVYYLIPIVRKMRACSMIMMWFSFPVILLTILFFKDIVKDELINMNDKRKKKWRKGIFITMGVITILCLIFTSKGFVTELINGLTPVLNNKNKFKIFENNFSNNFIPFLWLWWLFAMASLGMLYANIYRKISKYTFLIILFIIGLVDIIRMDIKFIEVISPKPYFYTEAAIKKIQKELEKDPFRCFMLPGTFKQQNIAGIHKIEQVSGFHDNELKWYREFRGDTRNNNYFHNLIGQTKDGNLFLIQENLRKGNNFLNIANVRYLITRKKDGELAIFKNNNALKRISFVKDYIVMDEKEIALKFRSDQIDINNTIILIKEPQKKVKVSKSEVNFTLDWEKYTPNYRKAVVETNQDGFLRISEVYYPGWEIKINGKKTEIIRADLAWMAINISKGKHTIEMRPKSLYYKKASIISFPIMLLLLSYWIFMFMKIKKKKS